jgi:hypothetical protein
MWPRVSCALVPVIGCISGDRPFGDICYLPGKFVPGVGHVEMLLRLSRGPPPRLSRKSGAMHWVKRPVFLECWGCGMRDKSIKGR